MSAQDDLRGRGGGLEASPQELAESEAAVATAAVIVAAVVVAHVARPHPQCKILHAAASVLVLKNHTIRLGQRRRSAGRT